MSDLQDLAALIRADTPLIVIETPDEPRTVELFRQSLTHVWRALYRWSITEGLRRIDLDGEDPAQLPADAGTTLAAIRRADQRGVYLLLDFHPYLGYAGTQRQLREILQRRDCLAHTVVMVGHKVELPPELEAKATRLRLRLPDANQLLKLVREEIAAWQRENDGRRLEVDEAVVRRIVRNLQGLDAIDARRIVRHLIHSDGALGPDDLPELARLKFELLNRSGHLHYEYDKGLEQHLRRHRGAAPAGVHRVELAVHRRQQRIDHGAQLAQRVCLRHALFKADVAEHRPLEVLVASHRPRLGCSPMASDRSGQRGRRRGIFQRPARQSRSQWGFNG